MSARTHIVPARRWARSLVTGVLACAAVLLAYIAWTATASHAATPAMSGSFALAGVTTTEAGTVQTVDVTALTSSGKPNPGYRGTLVLTSSDALASLPVPYTFTNADKGTHSFSVTLRTAGSQKVTATDSRVAAMTGFQAVTITPGPAAGLTVGGMTDATAGTVQGVTLTALDAYRNVATGYRGTIHVISSDPQAVLPGDFGFSGTDAGSRTVHVTLKTVGVQKITLTDPSNPSLTVTSPSSTVSPGPATALRLSTDLAESYGQNRLTTAGQSFRVTIAALDAYGNTASGYLGTVRLTSSDGRTLILGQPGTATLQFGASDAGTMSVPDVAFFTKRIYADVASLTVVDTTNTRMTAGATFTVLPGPAVGYAACPPALNRAGSYQQQNSSIGVNDDLGLPFTALDAYGNNATNREPGILLGSPLPHGYEAHVTVTTTDPQAANIVGNFTGSALWIGPPVDITFRTAGPQTVTITDPAHQDPSGHDLTTTCSYSVHGPLAWSGTMDIDDPYATGNTVYFLIASAYLPPNDPGATVDGLSGPYVGDATTGYHLLGAVTPVDGLPEIRWDLDPAVVPNGMLTCDTTQVCAVAGPKQITYTLRDPFGNTSVGEITLSPWSVSTTIPVGNIVYNGPSVQITTNQALPLGTPFNATIVSAGDGKLTVKTADGVAITMDNSADSGIAVGTGVFVRIDQPLNVGGQELLSGCIPGGGLFCPVPSFATVTIILPSTYSATDPSVSKMLIRQGFDACFLPGALTECPRIQFVGAGLDALTSAPPDATAGTPYDYQFNVVESPSGETITFSFIAAGSSVPNGLSLTTDGRLSGTPTTPGTYVFFVEARGMTSNATATARVQLTVK